MDGRFSIERFSIENWFGRVSFSSFRSAAEELESALRAVRPEVTSEVIAYSPGHFFIPEFPEVRDTRERCSLDDLGKEMWGRSHGISLHLYDNSVDESYMVCLTHKGNEPRRFFYYARCLDEGSREVFGGFRKAGFFQSVGDGWAKKI